MTTYQALINLENDLNYLVLLKSGVIPLSILDRKIYYEFYIKKLITNTKMDAIQLTAEEYQVSEMTIRRAIDAMI